MPRRTPPSSLRLVQGPLPVRGQAKHTLPSVPRPVHVPTDISRTISHGSAEPRIAAPSAPAAAHSSRSTSVYASTHTHADVESSRTYGRPRRRPIERGLETSGLALPSVHMSSSSGIGIGTKAGVRSSSSSSSSMGTGYSSSSSTTSSSPSNSPMVTTPSPGPGLGSGLSPSRPSPMRGPWDHSRAVSLPIDVGSVLALPKPVAISP